MGDVLVLKARLSPQIDLQTGALTAPVNVRMGGGARRATPLTSRMDRSPIQAATARGLAQQSERQLGRQPLPSSESDPDKAKQIAVTRAGLKDKIDAGQFRSTGEQLGAESFRRLTTPRRRMVNPLRRTSYGLDAANRAATSAGKVGVLGAKTGQVLGGIAGLGMGILSGATALSDASAAGQDFGGALAGAGLRGLTTGSTVSSQLSPALSSLGGYAGSRLGEKGSLMQQRVDAHMANRRAARAARPVAVAGPTGPPPTVAQPTTPERAVLPTKPIFTGQGPTIQMRYSQQLTPDQLRARQANIETSAKYNLGNTPNQQAELRHIDRQLNPSTAAEPFNPQVQSGAIDEMFGQRASYTPGSSQFNVPSVASPVNQPQQLPVMVQPTLQEAIKEFGPKTPGAPEGSLQTMNEEQGAAGKQTGLNFMQDGMGSMASNSSAGQQKPKKEEEQ